MNARILVVDDQVSIISIFARHFEGAGCSVRGAGSAEEAIAVVEKERFDVIFLDNVLPGMSGLRAIAELRRRSKAPIFMITGHFSEETRKDALLLGAADMFSKPLDFAALEQEVTRVMVSRPGA